MTRRASRSALVVALLLVVVLAPSVASAATQAFSYTIPARGIVSSPSYTISAGRRMGVQLTYASRPVQGRCYSQLWQPLTTSWVDLPVGPVFTLWTNRGLASTVKGQIFNPGYVAVSVKGLWYYNY